MNAFKLETPPGAERDSSGSSADAPQAPERRVEQSPRLQRLRQALLDAPYHLCTQKAELLTEFFRSHAVDPLLTRVVEPLHFASVRKGLEHNLSTGEPQAIWKLELSQQLERLYLMLEHEQHGRPTVLMFAQGLAYILERAPLTLYPDELIAGNLSAWRIGAPIHPDYGGMLMLPELRGLSSRPVNPLQTEPKQVEGLEKDWLPYWFHRSVMARAPLKAADPALQNTLLKGRDYVLTQFAGISHVTPNYPVVLERGFEGLLEDVKAAAGTRTELELQPFYEAMKTVCWAAMDFGARWHRKCLRDAEAEADPARAGELRALAEVFAQVPARPARTLHEALQSLFITHVMLHQESFQHGVSFGRLDQYLYPYYQQDVAEGRLDDGRAIELIGCFLAKAAEQVPLFNGLATEFFSGLSSASGITLGGTREDGQDATNPLTWLILEAYDQVRLRQPNLHLRVHKDSPPKLLERCARLLLRGGGMPAFFNDEGIEAALQVSGVSVADARDYSIVGCVEWGVPYRSFPAAGAGFLSLPAVLLDALQMPEQARQAAHSPPASMEDLMERFTQCLDRSIRAAVDGNNAIEQTHAEGRPTPLLSLLVQDCLQAGLDVTAGGARYDSSGLQGVGLADVADSLAAIEKLVFETGEVELATLLGALEVNFEHQEALRQRLSQAVAAYGEDGGPAEQWARRVAALFIGLVVGHSNPRGGPYLPGFWSMTTHIGFGHRLGALPSGRKAGVPLANGYSPRSGIARLGPTACLSAVARAVAPGIGNGYNLNQSLDPALFRGPEGLQRLTALTRGYFDSGGLQVQYNIIDPELLLDARAHPERHRELVVRVSGYSAYFVDLTPAMQDDIIARSLSCRGE